MSYDVYWVKNRAEKIADFEHPTLRGTHWGQIYPQLRCFAACSGFHDIGPAPRNPQLILHLLAPSHSRPPISILLINCPWVRGYGETP